MTRDVTNHKVNGVNESLRVKAMDSPGPGGACHHYRMEFLTGDGDCSLAFDLHFQNGGMAEVGVNGITNEALLAIVEDRLEGFQRGKFACRENALALTKLQEAIMWLQKRTRDRAARGVEGTLQV
jgi:hypothetical protein